MLGFNGGVLGRIDDMIVVRGVNIYPSAIDSVIREYDKITEYQVIIKEQRSMNELGIITISFFLENTFQNNHNRRIKKF